VYENAEFQIKDSFISYNYNNYLLKMSSKNAFKGNVQFIINIYKIIILYKVDRKTWFGNL